MTSKCRFHPERDAVVVCNKHEHGYCQECIDRCSACSDPELYCRHRTYCVIWELCRKIVKARKAAAAG
ncbi:MAG: hypothetical protein AUK55_13560 [Syntrophobacteraceae bacterium CG2_30_61_12]|nr:MAG: hypothetical protein AUK55_13560 [Syntrophobacteraceae bacterium CG2_30_61_12]PIU32505.1 MAG: hypothetical protein COT06_02345 [Syntrophobacteraceae bacterium CG07_land_8_20_14_0_80_61_8]